MDRWPDSAADHCVEVTMYQNIAQLWTPDYHEKANAIQTTDNRALDKMLHDALENAIQCEMTGQSERGLYWLRCAMLAQDELVRRRGDL